MSMSLNCLFLLGNYEVGTWKLSVEFLILLSYLIETDFNRANQPQGPQVP